MVGLALIISMSALVSFSELLLALVSSIPCIPSPGLAGGEGDGMCVLRKCQITKKLSQYVIHVHPPPSQPPALVDRTGQDVVVEKEVEMLGC